MLVSLRAETRRDIWRVPILEGSSSVALLQVNARPQVTGFSIIVGDAKTCKLGVGIKRVLA
jgi:hypothetical protein